MIKIAIIGSCGAGKTCFTNAITGQPSMYSIPTIAFRIIHYSESILLYDFSGSPKFHSIFKSQVLKMHTVILCYDVTDIQSVHFCKDIARYIHGLNTHHENTFIDMWIVGLKTDLRVCVSEDTIVPLIKMYECTGNWFVGTSRCPETFGPLRMRLRSLSTAASSTDKEKKETRSSCTCLQLLCRKKTNYGDYVELV